MVVFKLWLMCEGASRRGENGGWGEWNCSVLTGSGDSRALPLYYQVSCSISWKTCFPKKSWLLLKKFQNSRFIASHPRSLQKIMRSRKTKVWHFSHNKSGVSGRSCKVTQPEQAGSSSILKGTHFGSSDFRLAADAVWRKKTDYIGNTGNSLLKMTKGEKLLGTMNEAPFNTVCFDVSFCEPRGLQEWFLLTVKVNHCGKL